MNTQEFSNTFDTLLNSYNVTAGFGEDHSKQEITLNEYEKSVFLTQAQDIILKNYLFGVGTIGGLDDNSKKQLDFSALETVEDLTQIPLNEYTNTYINIDDSNELTIIGSTTTLKAEDLENKENPTIIAVNNNGIYLKYSDNTLIFVDVSTYDATTWADNKISVSNKCTATISGKGEEAGFEFYSDTDVEELTSKVTYWKLESKSKGVLGGYYIARGYLVNATTQAIMITDNTIKVYNLQSISLDGTIAELGDTFKIVSTTTGDYNIVSVLSIGDVCSNAIYKDIYTEHLTYDDRGILYKAPKDLIFIQNERMKDINGKNYTIVPMSYNEYDRRMSRPYTQPLKKQCWRIIHSNLEVTYELIPIKGVIPTLYRIRYIRRPKPIILVDLSEDYLDIDGITSVSECELPPQMHVDVLTQAVQLALMSRGVIKQSSNDNSQNQ